MKDYKQILEHIKAYKEVENLDRYAEVELAVLHDNLRQAYFHEKMPKILEILKKYEGKRIGEKTKDKINEEMKAKLYCHIYLYADELDICPLEEGGYRPHWAKYDDFTVWFNPYRDGFHLFDADGKLVVPSMDKCKLYCCNEYEEDIDEAVQNILDAHDKAKEAYDELSKAVHEFNDIIPSGIEQNSTYGFKNYIRFS